MLDAFRSPALTFASRNSAELKTALPGVPVIRRTAVLALLLGAALGCGSWKRVGERGPAGPHRDAHSDAQHHSVLSEASAASPPADPLPFVGTVAFAAGPADSVIGVFGLSLENRALAFQREGNVFVARYRVSLAFQRRGLALGGSGARGGGPGSHVPGDAAGRRERPVSAGPPPGAGHLQGERDRARRRVHLGEPRGRRLHGAPFRLGHLYRADPGVPGDGAGEPDRRAVHRAQSRAAPSATAATRCWRTSRATASPDRRPCRSPSSTSSRTRSCAIRSGSAAAARWRAR